MDQKSISEDELEFKTANALQLFTQSDHAESERILLGLINEARSVRERYFPCLYYGDVLMQTGRFEESRDVLIRSAQIAVNCKDDRWLVLSHDKLGDLSAAEENWFGALHNYRFAVRKAVSCFEQSMMDKLVAKADAARESLNSTTLSTDPTILSLSREYGSGNLAISFVQRDVFLKTYFARCLECNFCHDWCCSFGADIDIQNVEKIQQRKEEILPFIRPSEVEWFDGEYSYHEEYAGNQYTRINPHGPRCVFISKDQRGCGLHRYALSQQMDYHEIKPLVCVLFPLSFGEGILCLAPELEDNSLICADSGSSVYQSLREELKHYFGPEIVEELDDLEKQILSVR
jgi:Fe-S-cluster containining protein